MMLRIKIHQIFLVSFVEVLIKDSSVKPGTRLSMNSYPVTLKTLTKIHITHMTRHNNHFVVNYVEVHISVPIVK